ncbi:hypothetical protein Enr10x_39220 [Gimesia panareensis]|uniref:Uncharacterized protein n=1 Tax=Gimesia panareensis TaxID=2527978 RepID=A0A517QAB7_9PLAN|nr:hypothetical protein [Gimesia panareensis]QDT28578.1 hypothetical protein Enr10x_39220 [Gimesia panareensis]
MKKKATRKSAAAKKQAAPKKQAAKKAPKKKAAKKKAPAKKAANKKTTQKKTTQKNKPVKKSTAKSKAAKKPAKKNKPDQTGADQHPLQGKSTVFASARTNEWQPYPLLRIIEDQEIRKEMAARKDELEAQYEQAKVAYDLLSKEIELQKLRRESDDESSQGTDYGDVTGIAICFRKKYRQVLSPLQYVLDVNVSRKQDEGELKKRKIDPLPPAINGTPIKVREGSFHFSSSVEVGRLAAGDGPAHPVAPDAPILGGQPIADEGFERYFGTLGIVFANNDGQNFGLSNRHVTLNKTVRIISSDDPNSQEVGPVIKKVSDHLDLGRRYYVDASYFSLKPLEDKLKDDTIPYLVKDLENVHPSLDVVFAKRIVKTKDQYVPIYKYGAKTGRILEGKITSIETEVDIDGTKQGVIRVESYPKKFLEPGDSGSILLMKATVRNQLRWVVIGIVFGQLMDPAGDGFVANDHVAFACHMPYVLNLLKLSEEIPADKFAEDWTHDD